jgi:hypothetical protein
MVKKNTPGAVASFSELHHRLSRLGEGWIFRGHGNASWKLVPKAGRKEFHGLEKTLFQAWKLRAVEHLTSHAYSEWELLAIAQHHGLATRLLDWTTNPLNAAFFSVKEPERGEPEKGPAVIHAVRFKERFHQPVDVSLCEPLDFEGIGEFRPRGVVPRIVRQGGLFTIHGPPETSLEDLPTEAVTLNRIDIAEAYRPKLLAELARYGVNSSTLFPDLDGLSTYLNWTVKSGAFSN